MSNRFKKRPLYSRAPKPDPDGKFTERKFYPLKGTSMVHPWVIRVYYPDKSDPARWVWSWKVYVEVEGQLIYVGKGTGVCDKPEGCDGACGREIEYQAHKRLRAWQLLVPNHERAESKARMWPAGEERGSPMRRDHAGPVEWEVGWWDEVTGEELAIFACGMAENYEKGLEELTESGSAQLGAKVDAQKIREDGGVR